MLRGLATVSFYADDLAAAKEWYTGALGVKQHEPITQRGDGVGFATASVVDPFGNILGIMSNPHYVSVQAGRQ